MSNFVVFDIETRPQPIERLKEVLPVWDASSIPDPGEFDPASVKLGNLKDAAKIAEKIEAARAEHEAARASLADRRAAAAAQYWADASNKAALSAATGEVVALGMMSEVGTSIWTTDRAPEHVIIRQFWLAYQSLRKDGRKLVGFNSREFDIPFLAQRSIITGVDVPNTLLQNDRYLDSTFIDLRDRWAFGSRAAGSLDHICKACGIGEKPKGIDGSMFWQLFDDPATREHAIAYLKNDLEMTFGLAQRLVG